MSRELDVSRRMGADFCGLEKAVRHAAPLRFDRMQTSWAEIFPTLPITAEISVKMTRTYEGGIEPFRSGARAAG